MTDCIYLIRVGGGVVAVVDVDEVGCDCVAGCDEGCCITIWELNISNLFVEGSIVVTKACSSGISSIVGVDNSVPIIFFSIVCNSSFSYLTK